MAKTTPAKDSADDFDDLLADDAPVSEDVAVEPDVEDFDTLLAEPELTPEQIRIAELEAKLEALTANQPEPEIELTPEQKRIAELEAILADRLAPAEGIETARRAVSSDTVLFHFRKDGLLVLGNVWLRGQEIEIQIGSEAHKRTFNSKGESWLDILDDEDAQVARWGDRFIAPGPFRCRPGEVFDDEVAREDRKRNRRVEIRNI